MCYNEPVNVQTSNQLIICGNRNAAYIQIYIIYAAILYYKNCWNSHLKVKSITSAQQNPQECPAWPNMAALTTFLS